MSAHLSNSEIEQFLGVSQTNEVAISQPSDRSFDEQERHLETCEACQRRLQQLTESDHITKELQLLNPYEVDDELARAAADTCATQSGDIGLSKESIVDRFSFLEPTSSPDAIGELNRYTVKSIIGTGGNGVVFKAWDPQLNRAVAIKTLATHLNYKQSARDRFAREAKATAAIVHDRVLTVFDVVISPEVCYLVMEFIEGESLRDRIDRTGPLSIKETLQVATQVADGLSAAHEQELVHRDIKPSNILLRNSPTIRCLISDFGLVQVANDSSLTCTGVIAGTPSFMSPEQVAGDSLDVRSDLFSLGTLIYFCLTGGSPFEADNVMASLDRVKHKTPPKLSRIRPDCPPRLSKVVARLLLKDPGQRYSSATSARKAFEHVADSSGNTWEHIDAWRTRYGKQSLIASAVILLAIGSFFALRKISPNTQPTRISAGTNPIVEHVDVPHVSMLEYEEKLAHSLTSPSPERVLDACGSFFDEEKLAQLRREMTVIQTNFSIDMFHDLGKHFSLQEWAIFASARPIHDPLLRAIEARRLANQTKTSHQFAVDVFSRLNPDERQLAVAAMSDDVTSLASDFDPLVFGFGKYAPQINQHADQILKIQAEFEQEVANRLILSQEEVAELQQQCLDVIKDDPKADPEFESLIEQISAAKAERWMTKHLLNSCLYRSVKGQEPAVSNSAPVEPNFQPAQRIHMFFVATQRCPSLSRDDRKTLKQRAIKHADYFDFERHGDQRNRWHREITDFLDADARKELTKQLVSLELQIHGTVGALHQGTYLRSLLSRKQQKSFAEIDHQMSQAQSRRILELVDELTAKYLARLKKQLPEPVVKQIGQLTAERKFGWANSKSPLKFLIALPQATEPHDEHVE